MNRTTRTLRTGIATDKAFQAVTPPIYLSSNFAFDEIGQTPEYDYTRSGNPTRDLFAEALANAEGGTSAVVTGSGMAAVDLVLRFLGPDDVLVAPHDLYGGCHRLFETERRRIGFAVHYLDQTQERSFHIARELKPSMIWIETPSNPLLRVADLKRWAELASEVDAISVADNTFLSPEGQRPIEHGIDLVVHSTTKFINGHSDIVGGAVISADPYFDERLAWWANCVGCSGSPFDSWLALRGLRTLNARVALHESNALAVVECANAHPAVRTVHHPSLTSHPGHEIAARQQDRWGSLLTLDLRGGRAAVEAFCAELRCFTLAESLGGVESLVSHPATMTHASMTPEARERAGISDGLVRLSVGIEHVTDLVEDVSGALDRALAVHETACPV